MAEKSKKKQASDYGLQEKQKNKKIKIDQQTLDIRCQEKQDFYKPEA